MPISKAEADARCLVFDSGDEFAMLGGTRLAVDDRDRPYIRFGTGVVDWVRQHKDPGAVIVPVTKRCAHFAAGQWRISKQTPAGWPGSIQRIVKAPGTLAYGKDWPGGSTA